MIVYWGEALIQIYNDSFAATASTKHPAALGRRMSDCWPELAEFHAPILAAVRRGETCAFHAEKLLTLRHGAPSEDWFDLTYVPLRDDAGAFAGMLATVVEATARVLAEARSRFRLELEQALRGLEDPVAVLGAASAALGCELQVQQVAYAEIDAAGEFANIEQDWTDGSVPSHAGRHRMEEFGAFIADLKRGETIVVEDVRADPRTEGEHASASFERIGVRAFLDIPLMKEGRLRAVLAVHSAAPRQWRAAEIVLADDVAECTWQALERARAETALRRAEARFRTMADTAPVLIWETDEAGVVFVNSHYLDFFGVGFEPLRGMGWANFLHAEDADAYLAAYRAASTERRSYTSEARFRRADGRYRWLRNSGGPLGDTRFVGCSLDITELQEAQLALRASEARQACLLELSDALRPLADPVEIQSVASGVLGRHLRVARAVYGEVDDEGGVRIHRDYVDGVPSIAGRLRLRDFGQRTVDALRSGRPTVIEDVETDAQLSEAARAAFRAAGIRAHVGMGLLRDGRLRAVFGLHDRQARRWTAAEVALVQETADRTWAAVERARAEAALRESEDRYRQAMQAIDGMVFDWDVQTGRVVRSEGLYRLLGFDPAEVEPTSAWWDRRVHPDDVASEHGPAKEAMRRGDRRFQVECRLRHRDGHWVTIRDTGLIAYAADGRPLRVVGSSVDVTAQRRAEAALRESEARYRALFESIDTGFCVLELRFDAAERPIDYRIVEANPAFARHTGLSGIEGRWVRQDLDLGLEEHWFETYGRVALTGEPVRFENRAATLADRWFEVYAFRLDPPEARRVSVLFADISDRHKAEAALRASEARFRGFAENSADTLWIIDVATLQLEYLSPAYETLWGESREPVMRDLRRWSELIHPEDRQRAGEGLPAVLAGESRIVEYRIARADGGVRWVRDTGFPIRDADGVIRRVAGIAQDVTGERKIADALRESEARFREMADNAPMMIWVTEPDGSCSFLSRSWYEFTGQTPETGLGFGWLDAVHPEDSAAARDTLVAACARQEPFRLEYRLRRADGHYRWAIDAAAPRPGPGGAFLGYIGSVIDITDRKEAEARQALLAREVDHRAKNALAVVQAALRLTPKTDIPTYAAAVEGRVNALARTQALLAEERWNGADLGTLARGELAPFVARQRADLDGPPVLLPANTAQPLAMAIHELATNALKYGALSTPHGRVSLFWKLTQDRLSLRWAEIGGPPLAGPPARKGFGSRVLEATVRGQMGGELSLHWESSGLVCDMQVPLPQLRPQAAEGGGEAWVAALRPVRGAAATSAVDAAQPAARGIG
jgi:PAS domain S-box-containing protein